MVIRSREGIELLLDDDDLSGARSKREEEVERERQGRRPQIYTPPAALLGEADVRVRDGIAQVVN